MLIPRPAKKVTDLKFTYPEKTLPILPEPLRTLEAERFSTRFSLLDGRFVEPRALDVGGWSRFSVDECNHLCKQVAGFINQLRTKPSARERYAAEVVPGVPHGVFATHLGFPPRVYQSLVSARQLTSLETGAMSLRDFVALPGLGAKACLRVLGMIENVAAVPAQIPQVAMSIVFPPCRKIGVSAGDENTTHMADRLSGYSDGKAIAVECAEFFLRNCADARIAELLMRQKGMGGYAIEALRKIAAHTGVSHETVRNLAALGERSITSSVKSRGKSSMSHLQMLAKFVSTGASNPRSDLAALHPQMSRAYGVDFVASLYRTAEFLDMAPTIKVCSWGGRWVVLARADNEDIYAAVSQITKKVVFAESVGRFSRVMSVIRDDLQSGWSPDLVALALARVPGFCWIGQTVASFKRSVDKPRRRPPGTQRADLKADLKAERLGEWFWTGLVPRTSVMRHVLTAPEIALQSHYDAYLSHQGDLEDAQPMLKRRAADRASMPLDVFKLVVDICIEDRARARGAPRIAIAPANDESAASDRVASRGLAERVAA